MNRFTCRYCRGLGEGGREIRVGGVYGKWADRFTCRYSRGLRISMWVFSGLGYTVWWNKMNTEYKRICIYHIVIGCGMIGCVG